MADREFVDFDTTIEARRPRRSRSRDRERLHAIWGAGVGPQTAQAIFDENRPLLEEVIAAKLLAGDVEHGVIVTRRTPGDLVGRAQEVETKDNELGAMQAGWWRQLERSFRAPNRPQR